MNYFKLFFSKNSILRDFQNFEFSKESINGKCIELGASDNYKKNFLKKNKKYLNASMKYSIFSGGKRFRSAIIVNTGKIFDDTFYFMLCFFY